MKTKEIDVWVTGEDGTSAVFEVVRWDHMEQGASNFKKAKLIIELPEKKIEITEAQFDEICLKQDIADGMDGYCEKFWVKIKKELGF